MPRAGGTFTGAVTLAADPTTALQPATKQYVDAEALLARASEAAALASANAALPKAGGTMTGAIAMGANKITALANGSAATDAAAFGQIPAIATVAPLIAGTAAIGASPRWATEDHVHPGPSVTTAAASSMAWTYATKPVLGKLFAFTGAVAGTPLSLGSLAGITKVVRASGWIGDGVISIRWRRRHRFWR